MHNIHLELRGQDSESNILNRFNAFQDPKFFSIAYISHALCGSSPRMRGTVVRRRNWHEYRRFIPADAGNRPGPEGFVVLKTVHPRGCGEQCPNAFPNLAMTGSSPRMRGTEKLEIDSKKLDRFIPADAGNRSYCSGVRRRQSVHPRGCGEQQSEPNLGQ